MTDISELRSKVLQGRGVIDKKRRKKTIDERPTPYIKSNLMKMLELKYNLSIERLIMNSKTIYQLEKQLGVDATTISKWRKQITMAKDKEFFEQFNKEEH